MTTTKKTAKRKQAKVNADAQATVQQPTAAVEQPQEQALGTVVAAEPNVVIIGPAAVATASPKPTTLQGVRPGKTAPYHAGTVIKKHGMEAGVTPEMCKELCDILGHTDPNAEKSVLAWAWHVLNGYQNSVR